jgi:hypothetical protein
MKAVDFANKAYAADPGGYRDSLMASALPGGSGSPTINVTIENHVTGVSDPHKAAAHIADATEVAARRAAADLVREFAAVVR